MKGISPLIAAVLLIAFTMAIAGIMATWATSFSQQRLGPTQCALALSIDDLRFDDGVVTVAIRNNNNRINLTDIIGSLFYTDITKNKDYILKSYNASDPLGPMSGTVAVIDTGDTTRPERIRVVAGNCPDVPASGYF
jgi:flagellin-like protein